jgi:DNA invertase Pin-like site-specific DNA recombinase
MGKNGHRKVALCYVRKSLVRGESDQISPERQRRALAAWCDMHDYEPEFYEDADGHRSGRSEARRPEWQALRGQLTRPEVKAIIVETVSRSHRNLKELLQFVDEAERNGVRYAAIQEGFDASTAMGRLALQILGAFAEAWSNITSEKMQETIAMLKGDGIYWGPPPFATLRDEEGKLAIDPGGAWYHAGRSVWEAGEREEEGREGWLWRGYHDALYQLFDWYGQERGGYGAIATLLNQERYRARGKQGQPVRWTKDAVRGVLYNWREYLGMLTSGRGDALAPGELLLEEAWPPILPPEIVWRAQALMVRKGNPRRNASKQIHCYELTPLLYCAACGDRLEGCVSRQGVRNYRHSARGDCPVGRTPAGPIEEQARALLATLNVPESIWPLVERLAGAFEETHDQDEDARRLEQLQEKRNRLRELYLEGEFDRASYNARAAGLDGAIAELEARLGVDPDVSTVEDAAFRLRRLDRLLAGADTWQRKELYATFFERVEVHVGRKKIMRFTPKDWARPFF